MAGKSVLLVVGIVEGKEGSLGPFDKTVVLQDTIDTIIKLFSYIDTGLIV